MIIVDNKTGTLYRQHFFNALANLSGYKKCLTSIFDAIELSDTKVVITDNDKYTLRTRCFELDIRYISADAVWHYVQNQYGYFSDNLIFSTSKKWYREIDNLVLQIYPDIENVDSEVFRQYLSRDSNCLISAQTKIDSVKYVGLLDPFTIGAVANNAKRITCLSEQAAYHIWTKDRNVYVFDVPFQPVVLNYIEDIAADISKRANNGEF